MLQEKAENDKKSEGFSGVDDGLPDIARKLKIFTMLQEAEGFCRM
jgi:hypothetical protein